MLLGMRRRYLKVRLNLLVGVLVPAHKRIPPHFQCVGWLVGLSVGLLEPPHFHWRLGYRVRLIYSFLPHLLEFFVGLSVGWRLFVGGCFAKLCLYGLFRLSCVGVLSEGVLCLVLLSRMPLLLDPFLLLCWRVNKDCCDFISSYDLDALLVSHILVCAAFRKVEDRF